MKFFQIRKPISNELMYYLKDLFILLLSIFISIIAAEFVVLKDIPDTDAVDRTFTYFYFIVPVFSFSMLASYIYRNKRIKETGKAKSSFRYRLTLAFVFVSLLPSIPIFLLSSNVVGKIVESFYRIDISDALKSARFNIQLIETSDRLDLLEKAKLISATLKHKNNDLKSIFSKAIELKLLDTETYYISVLQGGKFISESFSLSGQIPKEGFVKHTGEDFLSFNLYKRDLSYILLKVELNSFQAIILGKRIHKDNERNIYNIIKTENAYNSINLWKEKVPFVLRLGLAIFSIGMFAISVILSFILARQISRPVVQLSNATQLVSQGVSDVKIDLKAEGEMGILINSFNDMILNLKSKNEELMHTQRIAAWKEAAQRMAHEIKNPLTPIQLSAERIRKRLDNPNKENFEEVIRTGTETIIGQVRVLEHLVKEFSEFARMPNPILINQNLNPLVEEAVSLFKESTTVQFELKLSKILPEVYLDKRLFLGVINNLIKNAIEAIQNEVVENKNNLEGKIRITTKLERKIGTKIVLLTIEDSGPGLTPDLREKIFEPYFSTKDSHGSGIGLTIVEKVVFDHHGRIQISDSNLGGCSFRIELPVSGNAR
ncbi:MAG: ATP-binding protein [Leptospiraceae bacterium]|nr:HAMP domain-containing protein [Leptospiraceae bacterium]MCK6379813.1 ATP-binding protein [Leptospiraceae bacterium]NUM41383.1 HAMP domain-containing protein [Leptospiraceae bacterium]